MVYRFTCWICMPYAAAAPCVRPSRVMRVTLHGLDGSSETTLTDACIPRLRGTAVYSKMACKLPSAELISAATCTIAEILRILCIRYEHACRPSQIGLAKQFGSLVGVALARCEDDQ